MAMNDASQWPTPGWKFARRRRPLWRFRDVRFILVAAVNAVVIAATVTRILALACSRRGPRT